MVLASSSRPHTHTDTTATLPPPQMTFAEIGTLYNTINNEVEGGVTAQNQALLFSQVITVQSQLQSLIDSGALNNLDGAGNPAISLVHAQNIADQLNFLKTEVGAFGTQAGEQNVPPKFINDVVRDIQDIVASDPQLTALAHQGNHAGFEQFSFLLAPPTPFHDSVGDDVFSKDGEHLVSAGPDGVLSQTGTLLNFIDTRKRWPHARRRSPVRIPMARTKQILHSWKPIFIIFRSLPITIRRHRAECFLPASTTNSLLMVFKARRRVK